MHAKSILVAALLVLLPTVAMPAVGPSASGPDRSLSPAEAESLGMPPLNRVWREAEYKKALEVLRTLPLEKLPRASSAVSAPIIDKIMDVENYQACLDEMTPIVVQIEACGGDRAACRSALEALGKVQATCFAQMETLRAIGNDVYVPAMEKDRAFASEFLVMVSLLTEAAVRGGEFSLRLSAAIEKFDPEGANRMREQVRDKASRTLRDAPQLLEDRHVYAAWARVRFARMFAATYPRMTALATPDARAHAQAQLRRIAREETDADIRAALAPIVEPE
jgi:hypothetical protein